MNMTDTLCNNWDEAVLLQDRYSFVGATMDTEGDVEIEVTDSSMGGTQYLVLSLEQLERLTVWARTMESIYRGR